MSSRSAQFLAATAAAVALALSACSSDDGLEQRAANDGSNYVAGDGSVEEFAHDNRGEPVSFEATLFDGEEVTPETLRDEVTVINFWYAACAPCRVEAPDLQEIYEEYEPEGVQFFGVNTRDTQPTAEAFERNFGITYPSIEDRGGDVMMAMTNYVPPSAVPTTLVLDREGRVSARILGIVEPGTLRSLIDTVKEEEPESAEASAQNTTTSQSRR